METFHSDPDATTTAKVFAKMFGRDRGFPSVLTLIQYPVLWLNHGHLCSECYIKLCYHLPPPIFRLMDKQKSLMENQ